jgi:Raf kinase inhibitor-like YbhB/YbcL family protein
MKLDVSSAAFASMKPIPSRYTCDGENVSPPIRWGAVPPATKSIALLCDDPDAPVGTWVHWVAYDISPSIDSLPENVAAVAAPVSGGKQGKNDFGKLGYGGPCPPGGTHRYFFKVYALDTVLNLPAGKTKKDLEKAMHGHVLAQGELTGVYARQ